MHDKILSRKILSQDTISSMIPLIQPIADDLKSAYAIAARVLASQNAVAQSPVAQSPVAQNPVSGGPVGEPAASEAVATDYEAAEALDAVQRYVSELEALGGTLRSYKPVRVDFISEVDGEIGYICWESGDLEPMHFHGAREYCQGLVLSS